RPRPEAANRGLSPARAAPRRQVARRLPPGAERPLRPPARPGRLAIADDRDSTGVRALANRRRPPRRQGPRLQLQEPRVGGATRQAIPRPGESRGREKRLPAVATGGGRAGGDV